MAALREGLEGPQRQLLEIAALDGACGDDELAIEALCRAVPTLLSAQFQYLWYPSLAGARKDPRFKELMRYSGLADFWRASGEWDDFAQAKGDDDFEIIR